MAQFDGHAAKRQRTDNEGDPAFGGNYYNNNFNRGGGGRQNFEEKPNHILLITVMNPAYPITTDVIHTICSPSGKVLRIVIFKKNGVQAMVEFDSLEAAERAKQSLNGCDIYSGCCTLKIEFAKPTRLNVYKNDNESWDYTNNTLSIGKQGGDRPALLQEPPRYGGPGGNAPPFDGRGPPSYDGGYDDYMPRGPRNDPYGPPSRDPYGGLAPPDRFGRDPYRGDGPPISPRGPGYGPGGPMNPPGSNQQGSVMMAYGLSHERMNCDRLFNILCLYGNIVRIKFLKSKEGCAMIQMGDPLAVERAVQHLNGSVFFDSKLQLGYSKQAYLNDVQQPFTLPDGSPSFKDYMGNRNNRFTNPEAASKNRILPPSKMLHFFNAPFGISEDQIKQVFEEKEAKPPATVKLFQSKNKSERSSSGLLEFDSNGDALEALALANHIPIPNPGAKFPYILKLCFSSTGGRMQEGGPRGGGGRF
ncbi:LOW QUALITY PROTEIN: heterogeneous nuclear ribonucleoprotein L-like [Uloborus diversus]|uniref:LOW QUALITY PROTEIN: heterogeneous nuclear ribonucleoprotein L-like n=1 Tax=Uloborus diversus TaxID=327109 RepID=UPI0024090B82|nr:LOW QUALITY PROTEIN: heterogeneous nuclear ribonucleoprotein L-like [Uloborus diversus]